MIKLNLNLLFLFLLSIFTISTSSSYSESEKFYVERINIYGNNITHESVIRSKLEVDEGDPYNKLLSSKSKPMILSNSNSQKI